MMVCGGSKERSASDNSAIFGYRGVLGHGTPIAGWMNGLFPWKRPIFKSMDDWYLGYPHDLETYSCTLCHQMFQDGDPEPSVTAQIHPAWSSDPTPCRKGCCNEWWLRVVSGGLGHPLPQVFRKHQKISPTSVSIMERL